MTHLRIELNTGLTEEVNSSIISKLYELAISGDLDETSDLKGRLHSPLSYRTLVLYLNTNYSDLHISVDDYAIPFEDPNVVTYLNSIGVGSSGMITEAQAAAATVVANSTNTTITKFNELKYFTNITESKGGFNDSFVGKIQFSGWTALEEVDISNLTSIGHNNGSGWEDTFANCSSLKKVTASNNLTKLGYNAFSNCQKLDTFTGLEGTVEVWDYAFFNCKSLPQSFFQPLSFLIKGVSGEPSNFCSCNLLESITIAEGTTTIPVKCFRDCPKLSTVTLPSTVIKIDRLAFIFCDKLSTINLSDVTSIGDEAFLGCTALTTVDLSNCTSIGWIGFANCKGLTSITLNPTLAVALSGETFSSCENLTTINNSHNISVIDEYTFNRCHKLTSLDLSGLDFTDSKVLNAFHGDAYSERSLFYQCENLTTLGITSIPITKLGTRTFVGCASLQGELNFPNLTTNTGDDVGNSRLFQYCTSLTKISLGHINKIHSGSSINDNAMFYNCTSLKIVDLGDSISEIGIYAFKGCSSLAAVIINKSVPPAVVYLGNSSDASSYTLDLVFGNSSVNIYVPDVAVDTYKSTVPYSNFASNIKPLSTYDESTILGL